MALWTRTATLALDQVYAAPSDSRLVTGTLVRGTIHTASDPEYPACAQVTAASTVARWFATQQPPNTRAAGLNDNESR